MNRWVKFNDSARVESRGWAIVLVSLLATASPALAVPLFPGQTVDLNGIAASQQPLLSGPVIRHAFVEFIERRGQFFGTIEIAVVDGGRLIELYRIVEFQDNGEGFEITHLKSAYHFTDEDRPLDVDFLFDSPGEQAPDQASFPDTEFYPVRFSFEQPLSVGETSQEMFVVSNADLVTTTLLDWGATVTVKHPSGDTIDVSFPTYLTFIPEPGVGLFMTMIVSYFTTARPQRRP